MQASHLPTSASCSDETLADLSGGLPRFLDLSICQAAIRSLPAAALPAMPKPHSYHLPRFQRQPR